MGIDKRQKLSTPSANKRGRGRTTANHILRQTQVATKEQRLFIFFFFTSSHIHAFTTIMSGTKIFVVTGANKGIGYAIVRGLAKQVQGAVIYLTARNVSLGEKALGAVRAELGAGARSEVRFHQLDISSPASCAAFASHLQKEHGGIDVLINNAGIAPQYVNNDQPATVADLTIAVNYYDNRRISDVLLPLIRPGGRIVNLCSQAGLMALELEGSTFGKHIPTFDRPDFTLDDIDAFVEGYKKLMRGGKPVLEGGYPDSAYRISKAALVALSVLQARELRSRNITVHPCCPGYVDTDLTQHKGPRTIEQGADTPIWLATAEGVPVGEFVLKRKVKDWLRETTIDMDI